MKHSITLILLLSTITLSAQTLWYQTDSLRTLSRTDSIPATEEYTVMTVVRSLDTDTFQLLWGIMADDTLIVL